MSRPDQIVLREVRVRNPDKSYYTKFVFGYRYDDQRSAIIDYLAPVVFSNPINATLVCSADVQCDLIASYQASALLVALFGLQCDGFVAVIVNDAAVVSSSMAMACDASVVTP